MDAISGDFISGDLDRVFTVLYEMGRVEPMLQKDWKKLYREAQAIWPQVSQAIHQLNELKSFADIRDFMESLPSHVIDALVVEVAREMAGFQERTETLH